MLELNRRKFHGVEVCVARHPSSLGMNVKEEDDHGPFVVATVLVYQVARGKRPGSTGLNSRLSCATWKSNESASGQWDFQDVVQDIE